MSREPEPALTEPRRAAAAAGIAVRSLWLYALLVGLAASAFLLVFWIGQSWFPTGKVADIAASQEAPVGGTHALSRLLGALVVIIVTARVTGAALRFLGQPAVIGEVIAGILLGPSVLGMISPELMRALFPPSILPILNGIAQLGIILYMFLVGLHLNSAVLRSHARATVLISHASIFVPFLLGTILAVGLYRDYAPGAVPFTSFALFFGLAMAITAFPVLARILTDRGMERTSLGVIALSCAAVGDATAWCLLALVAGLARGTFAAAWSTVGLSITYVVFVLFAVRPILRSWIAKHREAQADTRVFAVIVAAVLISALVTDLIGIHALFGAFLLGAIIPHDSELAAACRGKLDDVVRVLMLPAFFAYTGMRTQIGLLSEPWDWLVCGVVILVATVGKFGGSLVAARLAGLDWRMSSALGILMNTRGLMELIVLNVGLDLGILSPPLFAMMVVMALVTTIATTPLLSLAGQAFQPDGSHVTRGSSSEEKCAASMPNSVSPPRRAGQASSGTRIV